MREGGNKLPLVRLEGMRIKKAGRGLKNGKREHPKKDGGKRRNMVRTKTVRIV